MDNKRVTNKQILDKIDDLKVGEEGHQSYLIFVCLLHVYYPSLFVFSL